MDFARASGVALVAAADTNTLNGLFMKELDRMPKQGDEIGYNDLKFIAIDKDGNRVGRINVYPKQAETSEGSDSEMTTEHDQI